MLDERRADAGLREQTDQPGAYWYHAHGHGQYPDGLRGPMIVDDPNSPHAGKWDKEYVLTLSDWYHEQMPGLIQHFISLANPSGAEPVPQAALMNDTQNLNVSVEPGKTYLFRVINIGALAALYLWFEGHKMRVVEVDGVWTEEKEAEMLYISAAQRYSILVTTKNETSANFPIVGSMDQDLFDAIPPGLNPNVTGWLVYDDGKDLPKPKDVENAWFNNITYVHQKVPTLYTALTAPSNLATNPAIYSQHVNPFILEHNETVEIILNNNDPGKHPFHLHGHQFQTVHRSPPETGPYNTSTKTPLPKVPMRRDTVLVHPNGNIVLRFKADNPGIWLFHCHIEWHMDSGLVATMIESPLLLRESKNRYPIPESHFAACRAAGTPYAGNAGANTKDFLDLSNENVPPAPLPAGFTARGIVALVFSTVAAAAGIAVIVWYGLGEIKGTVEGVERVVVETK
ncbi:hypothetical protein PRK78_000104 [Emydomyces testavorans]|uniref:Iron transport multicopper oxidase FET3 n=1 Tax=Emydomyces testavorans TaxID=2070801 RepID=A0AAF0DBY0_9EURO|nr:hypothetical protein PRK78_000104 [Emydomyces testavorans]